LNQDWSAFVPFSLPARTASGLNPNPPPPRSIQTTPPAGTGGGTGRLNRAGRPVGPPDRLYVANTNARNEVRFEPALPAHLAESRVTVVQGGVATPHHLNPHIVYSVTPGPQSEIDQSVAFPTGMAFSSDGNTLYVAAFGSGKVGVFDASSLEAGTILENQV